MRGRTPRARRRSRRRKSPRPGATAPGPPRASTRLSVSRCCVGTSVPSRPAATTPSQHHHRVAERVEAVPLRDRRRGRSRASPRSRRRPSRARGASSAGGGSSSASASTRLNAKPGRDEERRPPGELARARDRLEHAHGRRPDGEHALAPRRSAPTSASLDRVPLAVQLVLLEPRPRSRVGTCRARRAASRARGRGARRARGVKWRPAVGAAAEPVDLARTRSGSAPASASGSWMYGGSGISPAGSPSSSTSQRPSPSGSTSRTGPSALARREAGATVARAPPSARCRHVLDEQHLDRRRPSLGAGAAAPARRACRSRRRARSSTRSGRSENVACSIAPEARR